MKILKFFRSKIIAPIKKQLAGLSSNQVEASSLPEPPEACREPGHFHSLGASYSSKKEYHQAFLAFAEAFAYNQTSGRFGHLFRMACSLVRDNNLAAAYDLGFLALKNLRNNSLFIEFFNLTASLLSLEQMKGLAPLFVIGDDFSKYYDWLEHNPFLLACIIDNQKNPAPELIELLNIKVINKKAPRTIICFTSRHDRINELQYQFTYIFSSYDCNLIYIRDLHDAWYSKGLKGLTTGVLDTAQYLKDKLHKEGLDNSEIFTIGSSAGGYAALLFGNFLGAKKIVGFAPQTLLPRPLPMPDTKCLENVDPTYFDLLTSLDWSSYQGRIHLFYSQDYENDLFACERMQKINGLELHGFAAGKEHNIAGWLKTRKQLAPAIEQCFKK